MLDVVIKYNSIECNECGVLEESRMSDKQSSALGLGYSGNPREFVETIWQRHRIFNLV